MENSNKKFILLSILLVGIILMILALIDITFLGGGCNRHSIDPNQWTC